MSSDEFFIHELERHETKDVSDMHINGDLTVVWRDWDNVIKDHPKMVYLNTVNPGEIKGPHLHKNRTTYFSGIHGSVVLIIKDSDGKYHEIECNPQKPSLICVRNGIAAAIVNPSKEVSKVLVLADIAWKPNDNEMENIEFVDYDFKKWN